MFDSFSQRDACVGIFIIKCGFVHYYMKYRKLNNPLSSCYEIGEERGGLVEERRGK